MKVSESEIQQAVVHYIRSAYPKIVFTSTLGGLKLSIGAAMKIKRQGYQSGIPDLIILKPNRDYHGLCIELKSISGKPSIEQLKTLETLSMDGYATAICYTVQDAVSQIQRYMSNK